MSGFLGRNQYTSFIAQSLVLHSTPPAEYLCRTMLHIRNWEKKEYQKDRSKRAQKKDHGQGSDQTGGRRLVGETAKQ